MEREYVEWEQVAGEDSIVIRISRLDQWQRVKFFLPDDREVEAYVDVLAKVVPVVTPKQPKRPMSLLRQWRIGYRLGLGFARKEG